MSTPHTIDGTWPEGVTVVEFGALFGPPDLAGADVSIPRLPGELPGGRTPKGRDYPMVLRVRADSEGQYNARARTLVDFLVNNGETFTLGRSYPDGAGTRTETALARYKAGGEVVRRSAVGSSWMGECMVVLRILDAAWTVA